MLNRLKHLIAATSFGRRLQDARWLADVRRYKSRLPRDEARKYDEHLSACRSGGVTIDPKMRDVAESWERDGYAVFSDPSMVATARRVDADLVAREAVGPIWTADGEYAGNAYRDFADLQSLFAPDAPLAHAIRTAFGAEFKLYYCKLYRSIREADARGGSQLWHSDGGPGTCMNLMFALTSLTVDNGAMELLRWGDTLDIFSGERAHLRAGTGIGMSHRDAVCAYYADRIEAVKRDRIVQPVGGPGTALMFRNNLVHRGGYPAVVGAVRRVLVFHVYPSDRPAPLDRYARDGLVKSGSYPKDPAFI